LCGSGSGRVRSDLCGPGRAELLRSRAELLQHQLRLQDQEVLAEGYVGQVQEEQEPLLRPGLRHQLRPHLRRSRRRSHLLRSGRRRSQLRRPDLRRSRRGLLQLR
jgi:hypothetical protein